MKFIIWGAGHLGVAIFNCLKPNVVAFIDNDSNKIGMRIDGVPIISFDEYNKNYRECYIIISPLYGYVEILNILKRNGIYKYFILDMESVEVKKAVWKSVWKQLEIVSDVNEHVAIYGLNLTSIILYLYLRDLGLKKICLVAHEGIDERLYVSINVDFEGDIIDSIEQLHSVDKIITVLPIKNRYSDKIDFPIYIQNNMIPSKNIDILKMKAKVLIDLYSEVHKIAKGPWKKDLLLIKSKLNRFKNCHDGQRCFIVGNGPSLNMDDLKKLYITNSISMGVNNIFLAFEETEWRPTYYVVSDYLQIHLCADEILSVPAKAKFISKMPYDNQTYINKENISKIDSLLYKSINHEVYRYNLRSSIGIGDDFSDICYLGGTVINVCIQMAFYMGFKEIFLLGVDCDYSAASKKCVPYFTDKYNDKLNMAGILTPQDTIFPIGCEESLIEYQLEREYADMNGIKIFNATRGGKLDAFERVNFDNLFE